jgi:hypothetical protein
MPVKIIKKGEKYEMMMTTNLSTQTNEHKRSTTYDVVYLCPGLRKKQQCGRAKPVKLTQTRAVLSLQQNI